jgi:general secretion pathway protein F
MNSEPLSNLPVKHPAISCVDDYTRKYRFAGGDPAGAALSDAMAAERAVFPDFYISMVRAGEAGASLEAVLARLSEFLDRSQAIREHVKSALLYPLIVAVTCVLSISMLFIFVVPRFKPLFEQAGSALPLTAQALLTVSDFIQDYWWVLVVVPLLAIVVTRLQLRKPAARARLDRRLLRLPLVGALIAKVQTVRFARTLGTALKNGVSLETALSITRETLSNRVFARDRLGFSRRRFASVCTPGGGSRPCSARENDV